MAHRLLYGYSRNIGRETMMRNFVSPRTSRYPPRIAVGYYRRSAPRRVSAILKLLIFGSCLAMKAQTITSLTSTSLSAKMARLKLTYLNFY